MYKAYKFRIYPSDSQKELIHKNFGCKRYVYNYYLNRIKNNGYVNAYTNIKDYTSSLKYEAPFLTEVDSLLIRKSIFSLDDNFKKHYQNGFGFPKFKSKYERNSYSTNAIYGSYKDKNYCNIELDLVKRVVKLPKLKEIKIRGYRTTNKINGKIINATISKEANNKYYVSIVFEIPNISKIIRATSIVGIDVGIKKLLTLSDGTIYDNNKYLKKYEKRIKRKQRELSRKERGSNNYYKCKRELNILYIKLKNARKFYLHKITKDITDNNDIIITEKLTVKKMIMKKTLSKNLNDAALSEIIRQLTYKTKHKGKYFYQIDTYYPSSQVCSVCGTKDKKYKDLMLREYECTKCNSKLDRDYNASVNIMFEGLKLYMKENLA